MTIFTRSGARAANALRPVRITRGYTRHAEGSVLIEFGGTKVLCTASVEERVPPHKRGSGEGWVTAEYGMLPRATHTRSDREAARGKQSGRTQEIQRLIGRALRAVTNRAAMGEKQIKIDCDVIQADGGTRTAAITGSYVALHLAFQHLIDIGALKTMPLTDQVARALDLEVKQISDAVMQQRAFVSVGARRFRRHGCHQLDAAWAVDDALGGRAAYDVTVLQLEPPRVRC